MAESNKAPACQIENIPAELKALNQWVLWHYETRDGKQTKVPYQPNGQKAESDNPATWASFERVRAALPRFDGLGIMFGNGLAGVDLDHHIEGGQISEYARSVVDRVDSYTELSPSGTGLHILFRGDLPAGRRRNDDLGIEMYSAGRFFTVTGQTLEGTPPTVNERTAQLAELHREIFKQQKPQGKRKPAKPTNLDDTTLLEKARNASNGGKFSALWAGDCKDYNGDQSRADLALCSTLAFWTGGDTGRIDNLFRSSGLMRPKWDEIHSGAGATYGQMTIEKSLQGVDFYNPRARNNGTAAHKTPEKGTDISSVSAESQPAAGPAEPGNILLTSPADHDGHALCVMAAYPGKFLFVEAYGWLYYNGKFWQREAAEAELGRAIIQTLRARRAAAAAAEKYELVKACHGSNGNVAGTRDRLKDRVTELVDCFDNDPDRLNCANGVLDLRTGKLAPHKAEQRFTYCLPVDYDPAADRGPWLEFLEEVLESSEMVEYLQSAVGYSITGQTWEENLFYLYGPPRSGKGTFTETMIAMMGTPLAVEADFQTFTADRGGDTQNFDLAPLKPCRFVAASESNKNQSLNPAKIKALTGRNYVRCAFKHRDHFQYQPAFKIWLSSNHPVNLDVDDDAAWGRVRVIKFPHSHLGSEDKALKGRLTSPETLRGVLAWAVEGARLWYGLIEHNGQGLPLPGRVEEETREQREKQDNIKDFLEECCCPDSDGFIPSGELIQAYNTWCESNGVTPKQRKQFTSSIERKGYQGSVQRKINGRNIRGFVGLKLAA